MIEPPRKLEVLVVASYPAARAGLATLFNLDPGIEAQSIAPDNLRLADSPPDLLAIDLATISEPELDSILELHPAVPALLIGLDGWGGGFEPGDRLYGFLAASADQWTLAYAAHALAAGLQVSDSRLFDQAPGLNRLTPPQLFDADSGEPLTARERQVLELLAAGLPNKGIAAELGISEHTAKFHVSSVLEKLGAGSRAEAVMLATRRGLLAI